MFEQISAMQQVLRDQRRSQEQIRKLASQRLRSVLVSAYENTVYYREAMQDIGYDPRYDFSGPPDLAYLPILTKQILKETDVRSLVRQSEAEHLDKYFCDVTSGTTGLPLKIYRGRQSRALQIAKWLRVLFDNGYRPHQRVMSFASQTQLEAGRSLIQKFGLFRRQTVGYDTDPFAVLKAIQAYRPHVIYGASSGFDFLFDAMEERGETLTGVELIIMTGEMIRKGIRERCKSLTGVEVTESYGTVEMGVMAYQTPRTHGAMQLNEDLTCFEFLDDNGAPAAPGQEAKIIVTDLTSKLMPFIRYEQGDRVIYTGGDSSADRRYIQRIIGRDNDYAILGDGTRRSFIPYYEALDIFTGLKRFRIIQLEPDLFDILIVADRGYFESIKAEALTRLKRLCGDRPEYRIRLVDEIPRDSSGKIRILISNVEQTRGMGNSARSAQV